jgi:hypothetical protein
MGLAGWQIDEVWTRAARWYSVCTADAIHTLSKDIMYTGLSPDRFHELIGQPIPGIIPARVLQMLPDSPAGGTPQNRLKLRVRGMRCGRGG